MSSKNSVKKRGVHVWKGTKKEMAAMEKQILFEMENSPITHWHGDCDLTGSQHPINARIELEQEILKAKKKTKKGRKGKEVSEKFMCPEMCGDDRFNVCNLHIPWSCRRTQEEDECPMYDTKGERRPKGCCTGHTQPFLGGRDKSPHLGDGCCAKFPALPKVGGNYEFEERDRLKELEEKREQDEFLSSLKKKDSPSTKKAQALRKKGEQVYSGEEVYNIYLGRVRKISGVLPINVAKFMNGVSCNVIDDVYAALFGEPKGIRSRKE